MFHVEESPQNSFTLLVLNWPQQMSATIVNDLAFYKHSGAQF